MQITGNLRLPHNAAQASGHRPQDGGNEAAHVILVVWLGDILANELL